MTRPLTLKLATSLDGRIATRSGESQWITAPPAREQGRRLRAQSAAVLVGSQTILDDDPALTVRLPDWVGPDPVRVVADGRLRTPLSAQIVTTARATPTLIVTTDSADPDKVLALRAAGVSVRFAPAGQGGGVDPTAVLAAIGEVLGRTAPAPVLCEGGGQFAAALLRADLVDQIEWFRAGIVLGDDGRPGVGALQLATLAAAPRFRRVAIQELGPDVWERYERVRPD